MMKNQADFTRLVDEVSVHMSAPFSDSRFLNQFSTFAYRPAFQVCYRKDDFFHRFFTDAEADWKIVPFDGRKYLHTVILAQVFHDKPLTITRENRFPDRPRASYSFISWRRPPDIDFEGDVAISGWTAKKKSLQWI